MNIIERSLIEQNLTYIPCFDVSDLTDIKCIKIVSKKSKSKNPIYYKWFATYKGIEYCLNLNRSKYYPFMFKLFCKDCNKDITNNHYKKANDSGIRLSAMFKFSKSDESMLIKAAAATSRCLVCRGRHNNVSNKDKAKRTCLERYGYESNLQNPDFHKKSKQTKIERYGPNYQQKAFKKAQTTYFNKTGYTHNMRNPECVEPHVKKRKQTIGNWSREKINEVNNKRLVSYQSLTSGGLFGSKNKNKRSKISIDFYENLIKQTNFSICTEKTIGKYIVDFLIPNVCIIEFYGTFWHADPKKYKPNDVLIISTKDKIQKTASDIWKKDKERINFLVEETKLPCIIIWEQDYKMNKQDTIIKVLQQINKIKNEHLVYTLNE